MIFYICIILVLISVACLINYHYSLWKESKENKKWLDDFKKNNP